MEGLKGYGLYVFLIFLFFALFASAVPPASAASSGNQNFIHIKFKPLKRTNTIKVDNGNNRQYSANVVIINSPSASNSVNTSKKSSSNITEHKTQSPDLGIAKTNLLTQRGNYRKNLSHIFPMIINREIIHYIHYYQTSGKRFFEHALLRSRRYLPMIKRIFKRLGLPNNLAYLAMIESGFSPTAYSYAGASGMWQFMPSTGRLYGLRENWWIDERRNPVESTYAAGRYLRELFNKFGSWYLAVAAYNSGELTIERALSLYPGGNFWTISENKPYLLPMQTRRYVPKIIAAAIIAKDPENFGFHNTVYRRALKFRQVNVPFSVSLYALAKCAGVSEYELRHMNQDLLRNVTPPNDHRFMLNIPAERYKIFHKNFVHIRKYMHQEHRVIDASYRGLEGNIYYAIKPGDTLMGIAYRYKVSLKTLERYNSISKYSVLRIGRRLVIPRTTPIRVRRTDTKLAYVVVKPGMTLWSISNGYNVPLNTLKIINHIAGNAIYSGEKIFIKSNNSNNEYPYIRNRRSKIHHNHPHYRVKFGDSLYSIALKFHDNVKNIMADNNIKNPNAIYPGEVLKINQ